MLPGLAAKIAGPASVLAWAGLLAVSALFALVFTALGTRFPDGGGVIAYTAAGLGRRAGRAVSWCFLTAVVLGAPVVCLIGAGYVTALTGGGRGATSLVAALLLAAVTVLTTAGGPRRHRGADGAGRGAARGGRDRRGRFAAVRAGLALDAVRPARLDGRRLGRPSVLMLSFVGWEAAAPLTRRLADPARSLPRITAIAFSVTTVVYLALAAAVVAVLGADAAGTVPAAALLRVAVGTAGPAIAAGAAVVLTLAAVNSYLTGAAALAAHLRAEGRQGAATPVTEDEQGSSKQGSSKQGSGEGEGESGSRGLFVWIAIAGFVELTAEAFGLVDATRMITLTTALFLVVYVASMASAARVLTGWLRVAAGAACLASAVVLAFAGVSAVLAGLVGIGALLAQRVGSSAVVDDAVYAPDHGGDHSREADPRDQLAA